MRLHRVAVVCLILTLAGCISGNKDTSTDFDDYFTGEPTATVIEVQRQSIDAVLGPAVSILSDEEDETVMASVVVQRRTSMGYVDFEKLFSFEIPRNAATVQLPVVLPANKNYSARIDIYDADRRDSNGAYYLIELGGSSNFGILAGMTNEIPVTTKRIEYDLLVPDQMYSRGDLRQFVLEMHEYNPRLRVSKYFGLKPWSGNGAGPFWDENAGHANRGIPNTGWIDTGSVPKVEEPTPLYYQVAICAPLYLEEGGTWMCQYDPDIEAGEPLPFVMIYPDPGDF